MKRQSSHLSAKDRGILYALFYENFVNWHYPVPKVFRSLLLRYAVLAALVVFPMKMEFVTARIAGAVLFRAALVQVDGKYQMVGLPE